MKKNYDELTRKMLQSTSSSLENSKEHPVTVLSLEDTIVALKNKYGDEWDNDPASKLILIWASGMFNLDHVQDVCKKYNIKFEKLMIEYRNYKTVNGKRLPDDFVFSALSVFT